jgi:hypothetical protein
MTGDSHLILKAVESGDWKPFNISKLGPCMSHLFFADDMLLFSEASEGQMKQVLNCLNLFCEFSGHEVIVAKTKIFFSKNVPSTLARLISHSSGFSNTDNLGKYLRVPPLHH